MKAIEVVELLDPEMYIGVAEPGLRGVSYYGFALGAVERADLMYKQACGLSIELIDGEKCICIYVK